MLRLARIIVMCMMAAGIPTLHLSAQSRSVTIKGSDTLVILGQRWAEACMKANPGSSIQVTGGRSGVGIAALINGTTDIAESSRPMKDAEKKQLQQKRGLAAVELAWLWMAWPSTSTREIR